MSILKDEFDARVIEIDKYFKFLEKLENDYRILIHYNLNTESHISIDDDLFKIFKANGFLLLYNLIESTILNSIIAIFDDLKLSNTSYTQVTKSIKLYWIEYLYKHDDKTKKGTIIKQFFQIFDDIINNISLEISKQRTEYAGSLDTAKIKDLCEKLGINLTLQHFRNHHKDVFLKIKENRNDLAHGKCTFSYIGKDISFNGDVIIDENDEEKINKLGLVHFKKFTIEHLECYIIDILKFIENKEYMHINSQLPQNQ